MGINNFFFTKSILNIFLEVCQEGNLKLELLSVDKYKVQFFQNIVNLRRSFSEASRNLNKLKLGRVLTNLTIPIENLYARYFSWSLLLFIALRFTL